MSFPFYLFKTFFINFFLNILLKGTGSNRFYAGFLLIGFHGCSGPDT